ncbi:MAG: DUF1080 domain-containing protein [Mariniphaga sp.]|nr:DUF1080 domain-containing protein [Mariniphaga sp.]
MPTIRFIRIILFAPIICGFILMTTNCSCQQNRETQKNSQPFSGEKGWISMFNGKSLEGWKITGFGTEGPVNISDGTIVLGMGDGCTGITWNGDFPKMNYEVSLDANKQSGNDFFCGMTFPAGDSFCSLIVGGWGGPVVGLSNIDGLDASENETRMLKKFEPNTWYNIRLKVTPGKIEAWIDNEQTVNFSTNNRKLTIRPEVELSKPFGICSWITTAGLKNIQFKQLDTENK